MGVVQPRFPRAQLSGLRTTGSLTLNDVRKKRGPLVLTCHLPVSARRSWLVTGLRSDLASGAHENRRVGAERDV